MAITPQDEELGLKPTSTNSRTAITGRKTRSRMNQSMTNKIQTILRKRRRKEPRSEKRAAYTE